MSTLPFMRGILPDYIKATRALHCALKLNDYDAWSGYSIVLAAKLAPEERAGLAFAALRSLNENDAYRVASLAIFGPLQEEVAA